MEYLPTSISNPIQHYTPHLSHQRKHRPQYLAQGDDIVLGDPLPQLEQRFRNDWVLVENCNQRLCFYRGGIVMYPYYNASKLFSPERNQDTRTNVRNRAIQRIGKQAIQRNRQGNITKLRHGYLAESIRTGCVFELGKASELDLRFCA